MDKIRGRTIVITGAARGIGRATAEALLARGARVVIGDRDVAVLDATVTDLNRLGQVSGYPLDVTDAESFAMFLDKARADGGGHIDVLINNAGVMPIGPFLDHSEQAVRSAVEVNFYGVLNGCRLVLPEMVQAPRRSHRQHRVAGRCPGRARPGPLRRNEIRGRRPVHGAVRRVRTAGRRGQRRHADVHQHRTDRRHQGHRRPEAGATRGHRRGRRQGARQAQDGTCRCRRRCASSAS